MCFAIKPFLTKLPKDIYINLAQINLNNIVNQLVSATLKENPRKVAAN